MRAWTRRGADETRAVLKSENCSIKTTDWIEEWPVAIEHLGVYPFFTRSLDMFFVEWRKETPSKVGH